MSTPPADAFTRLSLPCSLTLTEEEVKDAYDQSARSEDHLQARNALLSPVGTLTAWMAVHELPVQRHAPIPEPFIALFSELSELVHAVGQLVGKKEATTTVLAQTLLEKQLFAHKPKLDTMAQELQRHRSTALSHFPALTDAPDTESANILLQALKFIQKWEQEIDKAYTQLF